MRGVTQEDAQSIQCTLADYFRYVAGHVAYEYQGEAIARQAAILDAVKGRWRPQWNALTA